MLASDGCRDPDQHQRRFTRFVEALARSCHALHATESSYFSEFSVEIERIAWDVEVSLRARFGSGKTNVLPSGTLVWSMELQESASPQFARKLTAKKFYSSVLRLFAKAGFHGQWRMSSDGVSLGGHFEKHVWSLRHLTRELHDLARLRDQLERFKTPR